MMIGPMSGRMIGTKFHKLGDTNWNLNVGKSVMTSEYLRMVKLNAKAKNYNNRRNLLEKHRPLVDG